ncbi:hypothetical protein GYH30_031958 [Glycine max]|nr:hypothetical protein GYH30_031958 [Glycine max]
MYVVWCLYMTYVLSASAKANKMDTEMVESIDENLVSVVLLR